MKPLSLHLIKKLCLITAITTLLVCLSLPAAIATALSRGYKTNDTGLQAGMVVSLTADLPEDKTVERASQATQDRVVGVVTTSGESSVSIASDASDVLIETEGEVDVYVSDINGSVEQGALLVLSPLKGVLMKASNNGSELIMGIAVTGVNESTGSFDYEVENNGSKKNTKLSKLKVNFNRLGTAANNGKKESGLEKLGRSIVGKEVSGIRVFIALVLFVIVLIAEGGIIYGAVSSSIIALGRNPLAKNIIRKQLIQVSMVAVSVLLIGLVAVYFVLWL